MKTKAVLLCLLAGGVSTSVFAAIDLSARYSEIVAALTEPGSKECGETSGDDRGGGMPEPQACAWDAFRGKKAFSFTRRLAVSGEPRAEWDTFVGRSNGQSGPDKHIVDKYALTDSRGNESVIYIDMYHPDKAPINANAPHGMFLWW